ncbi:PLDc N-terminal domain-containing protein [Sphingobacterium sp.]|uniref:PLDc N-terminal domain-containing protein n=1 Tax=Sphingobacterium sp. TaxID=341027 RepID=UPI0039170935
MNILFLNLGLTEIILLSIPIVIVFYTIYHIISNSNILPQNKGIWIVLVLLFNFIGCVIYFVVGAKKSEAE